LELESDCSSGAGERERRRGEELLRFGAGDDLRCFAGDFLPRIE